MALVVDVGLLERVPYREAGQRTRHEYALTSSGHDFLPVLVALVQWGQAHLPPAGTEVAAAHADCGAPVTLGLRCASGHDVPEDELVVEGRRRWSPASPPRRST